LKPGNVKITPEGTVKVLDFGLAKALEGTPAGGTMSNSPTLTQASTNPGVILGTAAYMSPEQARGRAADQRSDVFSFGCVVYEMLTGRQAFQGEDVSEVLASVLKAEPDFSLLPAKLNPRIREMLRRCLQKNPKLRWHAIGDTRIEIEAARADPHGMAISELPAVVVKPPLLRRAVPVVVTAVLMSVIAGFAGWSLKTSAPAVVTRFQLLLPEDQAFSGPARHLVAISPDSTKVVYGANTKLFLRQMSEMEARPCQDLPPRTIHSSRRMVVGLASFRSKSKR
jgi:eukaryotic-like serine/threonine-protein kinase